MVEDGVGCHAIEEAAVVRYDHHSLVPLPQERLQPRAREHVEMVRRLVEEEEVGADKERLSKGDPHAPPPRELARALLHHFRVEPEAGEDGGGTALGAIRIQRLQPFVHIVEGHADLLLCHLLIHKLLLDLEQPLPLLVRLHNRLEGRAVVPGALLLDVHHVEEGRHLDNALRHCTQQRRFAHPIPADHAVIKPVGESERPSVDQLHAPPRRIRVSRIKRDALDANVHVHVGALRGHFAGALEKCVLLRTLLDG